MQELSKLSMTASLLKATHANLNVPITFLASSIFYVYHSPADKCTHIVSPVGIPVPVKESVEQIINQLKG